MRKTIHTYALAGSIALLTFLAYLPALRNDFVNWDDGIYIFDNPNIRAFSSAFFRWAFLTFHYAFWGPLTWISHALDYAVWGLNPLGHHLTNVVLHVMNTVIVVFLVVRLLQAGRARMEEPSSSILTEKAILVAAGATGLLFGLHPIHVESVAWITERKDVLCALFYLLAMLAYTGYANDGGIEGKNFLSRFTARPYLSALGLFLLALLSKPMAVTLPAVLLILDWFPFDRIRSRTQLLHVLAEKIPFFSLGLFAAVLTVSAQQDGGALYLMKSTTLSARILVAVKSLAVYLGNMILPVDLVPFYPFPAKTGLSWSYVLTAVFTTGITVACVLLAKKQRVWLAVWSYYVIVLAPVLGIIHFGEIAMADRFAYLPSLGPFLLTGLACSRLYIAVSRYGPALKLVSVAAAVTVLAFLCALTLRQIAVWKNSITLWSAVIEKRPRMSRVPYLNRGLAFITAGLIDKAIEDFTAAIEADPSFSRAYNNRGLAFAQTGRWEDAVTDLNRTIELDPSFCDAYVNRGMVFLDTGRFDKAIADFTTAAALNPSPELQNQLAVAYGKAGLFKEAFEHFDSAIAQDPDYAAAYFNSGLLHLKNRSPQQAALCFEKACRLGNPEACAAFDRFALAGTSHERRP